jgi:excisionase family DNA binding protein
VASLDELARDPSLAARLEPAERTRVQLQCAAILAALAQIPATPPGGEALLEPAEVALRLRVGRSTVYEMLRDGRLRYVEKGERGRLVPESAIHEFIERQSKRAERLTHEAMRARVKSHL